MGIKLLKYHSNQLFTNDLEKYSYIVNKCYLSNKSEVDFDYLHNTIDLLNNLQLEEGFITKNYSPKDDNNIKEGERVFYTHKNAIKLIQCELYTHTQTQYLFLAPLIVEASIHNNTSGVFKGFHKKDGIGHFGGIKTKFPSIKLDWQKKFLLKDIVEHIKKHFQILKCIISLIQVL